jgi:hypothetical protein
MQIGLNTGGYLLIHEAEIPNGFSAGAAIAAHGNPSVISWSLEEATHQCARSRRPVWVD